MFRATLHAFAFTIDVVIVAGWAVSGTLDGGELARRLALWYLVSLAPLLGGGWLGGWMAARSDMTRYRRAVHGLLLLAEVTLVVTALG